MWYPRGKFTGAALFVALFLFAVGETIYGLIAGGAALVLHLVMGGTWQGFLVSIAVLLAALGLITLLS